jgi:histone H3/H4
MWTPVHMQTGLVSATAGQISNDAIIKQRIQAILTTFMKRAIEVGGRYASAAGRDTLSSMDVLYALQYQTHIFIEEMDDNMEQEFDDNLPDDLNSNNDDSEDDSEDDADDDSEDDADDDSEDDLEDDADDDMFSRCEDPTDPLIVQMNEYHDNWNTWEPSNEIQKLLKNAIDKFEI